MQSCIHLPQFHLGILRHGRATEAIGRGQVDVSRERHGARHAKPGTRDPSTERPCAEDIARARDRASKTRISRRLDAELAARENDVVGNNAALAIPAKTTVDLAGEEIEDTTRRDGDRGHLRRRERLPGRVRRVEDREVVVRQRDLAAEAEDVVVDRDDRIVSDLEREIRRFRVQADLPVEHDLAVHAFVEDDAVRHVERGVVGRPVLVGPHHKRVRALDVERGVVLEMEAALEPERRAVEPREVERHHRRSSVGGDDRAEELRPLTGSEVRHRDGRPVVAAEVEPLGPAEVQVGGVLTRSTWDRQRRPRRDRLPRDGGMRAQGDAHARQNHAKFFCLHKRDSSLMIADIIPKTGK